MRTGIATDRLAAILGDVILPDDDRYDEARTTFNGMAENRFRLDLNIAPAVQMETR